MTEPATILHAIILRHPKLRPSTKAVYLHDLDRWVEFAGGDPVAWTRYKAQEFYESLLGKIQPQSANRVMASLSTAASWWAKLEGKPELDFTQILLAAGKAKKARRALTPGDATKLIQACFGVRAIDMRDFALLVVGLETGMRAMSLHGMRIENINATAGFRAAHVPLKGRDGLYPVPLSPTAQLALDPWLAWLRTHKITTGMVVRDLQSHIEPDDRFGEVSIKTLYNIIQRRGAAVGLLDLHPHILRHSMITWRLAAAVPPHVISVITGHRMKDQLGILYEYMDQTKFVEQACATTPAWLAALVKENRT